ncbi:MAG: GNAT family N-acetyltransferase [Anaerolineaceae bacterium]|nr:GNAT family N-acetyltransferase [Anaerolineaceae bacterium]
MSIDYQTSLPDAEACLRLFDTTGWNHDYKVTASDYARALAESQYWVSAYDGQKLIGFGRVVTDGVLHAMIYDMIVDPDHQGCGIGSTILNMLVKWCTASNIRDIQLFSARGRSSFYGKNGFNPRAVNAPGMDYAKQPAAGRVKRKVYSRRG